MPPRRESWRALGREMLSLLLGIALFLQLMGTVEMPRPAAGFDPLSALCSLHPERQAPDEAPRKARHDLCCPIGCSLHAKPWAGLPATGPDLPEPGQRILVAAISPTDPPPPLRPHAPHAARDPPLPA